MIEQPFDTSDWFSRPADSLLAAMQRRGVSACALAGRLDGGIDQLHDIVVGAMPIDGPAARAIGEAVGGSANFWLKRQANYERDLARVAAAMSAAEVDVWLRSIPAPEPGRPGRLSQQSRTAELTRRLTFYGVGTLEAWQGRYGRDREQTRFRTSTKLTSDDGAISLWLRQGELAAALSDTPRWDRSALEARLDGIKRLSRISKPTRFLPKLRNLLAEAGVALIPMRTPRGCKASGASRLVRPDLAMIMLSFRFRSNEQFWFTLFHEIGHLLLHGGQSFVDVDLESEDALEKEANDFASSMIIPPERAKDFSQIGTSYEDITRFAVSVDVAPALVLGQLQHRGRIAHDRLSYLRRIWSWEEIESAIASL